MYSNKKTREHKNWINQKNKIPNGQMLKFAILIEEICRTRVISYCPMLKFDHKRNLQKSS